MSRFARAVVPGFPHHVTQRGNLRTDVFEDDEDRRAYLRFMKQYAELNPVRAGMVEQAEYYPWSSAAAHCGLCADALLSNEFPAKGVIDDWATWQRRD